MRLTVVSETFFPQVNGVSRAVARLVEHARQRGHAAQVVIPRYPGVPREADAVTVGSLGLPGYPEIRLASPWSRRALARIAAFRPDLIHLVTEGPLGWAVLRFARRHRIPVVSSFHTRFDLYSRHYTHPALAPLVWAYLRWFHNQCLRTYCPTEGMRKVVEGMGIRRTAVWARGASTDCFFPMPRDGALLRSLGVEPGDRMILYVGRLAPEKNLGFLLETFGRIARWESDVRLVLVGSGPERRRLERRAPPGTLFAGYRSDGELARLYAAADLLAFPSLTETFGNVVLEAMASGLPVVAFRAGGVMDLLEHERHALLADPAQPETFRTAMTRLLRDERLRRRVAEGGYRYALTQRWEYLLDLLFQDYRCVLSAVAAGRPSPPEGSLEPSREAGAQGSVR
jgi:glycosyltransferase involved in cell wall biosynthesis